MPDDPFDAGPGGQVTQGTTRVLCPRCEGKGDIFPDPVRSATRVVCPMCDGEEAVEAIIIGPWRGERAP